MLAESWQVFLTGTMCILARETTYGGVLFVFFKFSAMWLYEKIPKSLQEIYVFSQPLPLFLPVEFENHHALCWASLMSLLFRMLSRLVGVSEEVRRGAQGDSLQESGKSGLHVHGDGERVFALESW